MGETWPDVGCLRGVSPKTQMMSWGAGGGGAVGSVSLSVRVNDIKIRVEEMTFLISSQTSLHHSLSYGGGGGRGRRV